MIDLEWFGSYALSILPLVTAHVLVPPLSTFNTLQNIFGPERLDPDVAAFFNYIYSLLPDRYIRKRFVESLVLDRSDTERLHTWISYMFVHGNYEHLFSNLTSLVIIAPRVYAEFGAVGMNALFIAGGVFAALPGEPVFKALFPSTATTNPYSVNAFVYKLTNRLGLSRKVLICGSSGGVCALLGANVVLSVKKAVVKCIHFKNVLTSNSSNNRNNNDDIIPSFGTVAYIGSEVFSLVWSGVNIAAMLKSMQIELLNVQKKNLSEFSLWNIFSFENIVGHEAHIQGFIFGVSVTCATLFWQKYKTHNSGSGNSSGNSSGSSGKMFSGTPRFAK